MGGPCAFEWGDYPPSTRQRIFFIWIKIFRVHVQINYLAKSKMKRFQEGIPNRTTFKWNQNISKFEINTFIMKICLRKSLVVVEPWKLCWTRVWGQESQNIQIVLYFILLNYGFYACWCSFGVIRKFYVIVLKQLKSRSLHIIQPKNFNGK